MTEREVRAGGEARLAGRTFSGVAMPYGTISPDFRERFEPGAFGEVGVVDVNLQHDPGIVLARAASLSDGPEALRVAATLAEGSGALALVRRGALGGFSVEFHAKAERREAGVRVVERAELTGLALVDRPAYPAAAAEVRARSGRTVRQRIPSGKTIGCRCSGVQCKFARITGEAMREAFSEAWNEAAEILAVRGGYGAPLASKSRWSVRARMVGDDAQVEIDLPTGPDGEAVLRGIEDTGAVLIRPYLRRGREREHDRIAPGGGRGRGRGDGLHADQGPIARGGRDGCARRVAGPGGDPDPGRSHAGGPRGAPEASTVAVTISALALAEALAVNPALADRLLPVASALVHRYAPEAPEPIANEAVIRCSGWLAEHPAAAVRSERMGDIETGFAPTMQSALRHSGAMALLSAWKVRRAGAIR